MSFKRKTSRDFNRDGNSGSSHQTFGQEGGGSVFPHHRLVILSLGLLNAVLLIAAAVTGIYCAKAQDLQVANSAATPIILEMNFLRNRSDIIRAKLQAQEALVKERDNDVQLKLQVKQQKTLIDILQGQIETLQEERTKLQANRTSLEVNCGRCPQGWVLLKSTCYFFSCHVSNTKKNWLDSRADCTSQGGELLVIDNLAEQQIISDNFPKQSSSTGEWWQNGFWIGLTDVVTEGTWVWVNNVTEVETMYWRNGQPNRDGPQSGNCAAFYFYVDSRKTWYNGNCQDHLFNWMCEMEPSKA